MQDIYHIESMITTGVRRRLPTNFSKEKVKNSQKNVILSRLIILQQKKNPYSEPDLKLRIHVM